MGDAANRSAAKRKESQTRDGGEKHEDRFAILEPQHEAQGGQRNASSRPVHHRSAREDDRRSGDGPGGSGGCAPDERLNRSTVLVPYEPAAGNDDPEVDGDEDPGSRDEGSDRPAHQGGDERGREHYR